MVYYICLIIEAKMLEKKGGGGYHDKEWYECEKVDSQSHILSDCSNENAQTN